MSVDPAVSAVPSDEGTRRVPPGAAFAGAAAVFVVFLAASSVPSPIYAIYQRQWDFAAWVLTVVFALYVVGLLASLLVRAIEGLVRWDMDAALRETKQPITVFAIRDLVTREAIDRYGDRLDIVPVDLGSHHFPVESPEATAKLLTTISHAGGAD